MPINASKHIFTDIDIMHSLAWFNTESGLNRGNRGNHGIVAPGQMFSIARAIAVKRWRWERFM